MRELIRVTEGYQVAFPEETFVRLQEMVEKGNPTAMGLLGAIYIKGLETGVGARKKALVEPDPEKGASLCGKGAPDDPTGYSQLCYAAAIIEGKGVPQDLNEAKEIYRRLLRHPDIRLMPETLNRIGQLIKEMDAGTTLSKGYLRYVS
ncbi:MAG: hypothetical protein LBJ21_05705, partial [Acidobacteriota bacterium]|nr:hypothetical protein [Acidobacteriota bacterium]